MAALVVVETTGKPQLFWVVFKVQKRCALCGRCGEFLD